MTECGVPDNRRNKDRVKGKAHQLPAGHQPRPDPRHNTVKRARAAAAEAARNQRPTATTEPASAPTEAKPPILAAPSGLTGAEGHRPPTSNRRERKRKTKETTK